MDHLGPEAAHGGDRLPVPVQRRQEPVDAYERSGPFARRGCGGGRFGAGCRGCPAPQPAQGRERRARIQPHDRDPIEAGASLAFGIRHDPDDQRVEPQAGQRRSCALDARIVCDRVADQHDRTRSLWQKRFVGH